MLENEISFVKAKIEELTRIMNDLNDMKAKLEALRESPAVPEQKKIVIPEKIAFAPGDKKCVICGNPVKDGWNACPGTCRRKLAWKKRREALEKIAYIPEKQIIEETTEEKRMEGTLTEEGRRFLEPREEIKKATTQKEKPPIRLPENKKKRKDDDNELTEREKNSLGTYEKCRVCGKEFFVPGASQGAWAYRDAHKNKLCSWHCVRELEKRNEKD